MIPLLIAGLALAVGAYVLLGELFARRVEDNMSERAVEIARAFSAATAEDGEAAGLNVLPDALAVDAAVTGVTVVDVNSSRVIASSDGWDGLAVIELPDDDVAAAIAAELGTSGVVAPTSSDVIVIPVPDAGSIDQSPLDQQIVAVSFDRAAVAADLEFARRQATLLAVFSIVILLLVAYALLGVFVTWPARRLAGSLLGPGDSPDVLDGQGSTADELALLASLTRQALSSHEPARQSRPELPAAIPDVRILADLEMRVLNCQLVGSDGEAGDGNSLELASLDDLFSETIVTHLQGLVGALEVGDDDSFEFSVGLREYAGQVSVLEGGEFILDVRELAVDAPESDSEPEQDPSGVLRTILGELPVVIVEADQRGVVRFVNRAPFDLRPQQVVGRRFIEIVPRDSAREAKEALKAAIEKGSPQTFIAERHDDDRVRRWINEIAVIGSGDSKSIMIASVEIPWQASGRPASPATFQQEDKLWEAELRVSDYETEIQQLRVKLDQADELAGDRELAILELREQVAAPLATLYRAGLAVQPAEVPTAMRPAVQTLQTTLDSLAGIFDEQLGLSLREAALAGADTSDERFHLPTLLDEIAIELGQSGQQQASRIRVNVQPSLPKWIRGDVGALKASIHQMVEIARIVAFDRPLVLGAIQEASKARSVQVRFSIQIPPPKLDADALDMLRDCISGPPNDDASGDFSDMVLVDRRTGGPAAVELVAVEDQAAVLRCSAEFEIAEEAESDQSWVRGLRTLIIQDAAKVDNGIQPALSAFGIIGYVVTDEQDLIAALKIAEEYSNPYRLVLADVNTTNLEAFVSHLFDGDAPVVLVGTESESAMVGALSAGYNGYLAKPVRQVDLLEVILSTVEPPQHGGVRMQTEDAA